MSHVSKYPILGTIVENFPNVDGQGITVGKLMLGGVVGGADHSWKVQVVELGGIVMAGIWFEGTRKVARWCRCTAFCGRFVSKRSWRAVVDISVGADGATVGRT